MRPKIYDLAFEFVAKFIFDFRAQPAGQREHVPGRRPPGIDQDVGVAPVDGRTAL